MRFASLLALTSFVSLAVALVHCGDDDAAGPAASASSSGTGSSSGTSGASSTSGGASSSSSSSSSGSLPNWPPPSRAACDAPTIDPPVVLLQSDAGIASFTGGVALAWGGKQAGILYVLAKGGPFDSESLQFQRLDHHGAKVGDAVNLSNVQPQNVPIADKEIPALTTDGTAFLACWALSGASATCASIPSEGAAPIAGFLGGEGTYTPALAYDGVARVMVARGASIVLDANAQKTGDFASGGVSPDKAKFAARAPGFIIAESYAVGSGARELHYKVLDSAGEGANDTLSLDANLVAVAGYGPSGMALVQSGTAARAVRLEPGAAPVDLDTAGVTDRLGAIASAAASYGAIWLGSNEVRYRGISSAGTPVGASAVNVAAASSSSKLALVTVDDGFLAAVLDDKTLSLVHIGCP